jgi:hypothetical protein
MQTNLIQQFNRWAGENKSLIQKALTGASGTGGAALIPQHLEQIITNAVPRISPELAIMTPKYDAQSLHEFNQLTALNAIGAAMGESSVTPTTQPTFTRRNVQLKVLKKREAPRISFAGLRLRISMRQPLTWRPLSLRWFTIFATT